ncbi:phage tail P2-like protein [Breoghania corrubedonensis]|uniref:Phage tail P2-like protein n=1 Tax=Breoghania corrubedonensis TaxID=665038 RepID=A0A2T5UR00_9HYPH|nr:phage tail protein I [Breoghania corrubedonensis]PTW53922.1 phage tail P2-like protein [Breoghania corrubedonensis]
MRFANSFDGATILPANATALELSLARVASRVLDIPVPLADLWSPDRCPAEFLPHLAAAFSVDFWDGDWDEAKKRNVIRAAVRHHRIKGTLAGMQAYAAMAGAKILGVHRPPEKFFAGGSDTVEQRLAWLESLPQVRIYRASPGFGRRKAIYAGGAAHPFFLPRRTAWPSTAAERRRPRAVLIRDGAETVIGIATDADGVRCVILRRALGRRLAASFAAGRRFALSSTAASTVAPISAEPGIDDPALARPLRPAGTGNGILPAIGSDPRAIGRAWFASAPALMRYAGYPTAAERIFERIPIQDDLAPAEPRKATAFAGVTRLAVPAHTAELKTSIPGRGLKNSFFAGASPAGAFAARVDKARLERTFAALKSAKRLSDRILIDTRTYRPFTAGQTLFAGQDIRAGRMTRA